MKEGISILPYILFIILFPKLILAEECYYPCITCFENDIFSCLSCPPQYYLDLGNNRCYKCASSCKSCEKGFSASCTECFDGYYIYSYSNNNVGECRKCSVDFCVSCTRESYGETCTKCADGYYINNNQCQKCDDTCLSCTGPNSNQCLTCIEGYHKTSNNEEEPSTCQRCADLCKFCTGPNIEDCSECKDGYYKSGNLCRQCDSTCKTCSGTGDNCTDCNEGFYHEGTTCLKCADHCAVCKGPNDDDCSQCFEGYGLYYSSCQTCQYLTRYGCPKCKKGADGVFHCTECPPGYKNYTDYDSDAETTDCTPCNDFENCLSCPYDENICTECKIGFYLKDNKCFECDKSCLKCENEPTKCTECHDKFFLDKDKCVECIDDNCIHCKSQTECTVCNNSYYQLDGKCIKCHESCYLCKDGTNQCDECSVGYYFDKSHACVKCGDNCNTCNSTHCISCAENFFPLNGICSPCADVCAHCSGPTVDDCTSCDDGFYYSEIFGACFKCDDACTACEGPVNSQCTSCSTGYYLSSYGYGCYKCEYNCKECTSQYDCVKCNDGFRLYKREGGQDFDCQPCKDRGCKKCDDASNKCTECIDGYYASSTDSNKLVSCSKCPSNCKKCSSSTKCIDCYDGYYLQNGLCTQCSAPCETCSDAKTCHSCINGFLFDGVSSCNSKCTESCLSCEGNANSCTSCYTGFFLSGSKCLQCFEGCKTCNDEWGMMQCTSCINGYYLTHDSETYKNICSRCSENCETCVNGNSNGCSSCRPGFFFSSANMNPNRDFTGECSSCDGEGHEHCELCLENCNDDDNVCDPIPICTKCSDGFYVNDENKCGQCNSVCKTCDGPGETDCITCKEGQLINNICVVPPDGCELNKHCEKDNTDGDVYLNYTLDLPVLDGYSNEESGGAVRLINYGFTCKNTTFSNCKSENGGGGGIFIYNNIQNDQSNYEIILKKLTFRSCKANFGAAVYIYSPSESSPVLIESCNFISNEINSDNNNNNNNQLSGGCAIYLTVKNGQVNDCEFKNNKGGSLIKVSDKFDVLPEANLLQISSNYTTASLSFRGCLFDNSDCSLFLENEKHLTKIEVSDCIFKGKLEKGAHFIVGIDKQTPNFLIQSCSFDSDENGALNTKIVDENLRNQLLAYNHFTKKNKLNSNAFLIVPTLAVTALVIIVVMTVIIKQKNDSENHNESLQA